MASKRSLLDQMRDNPRADWTISNVERLCRECGLDVLPPTKGSHYKVRCDAVPFILTIPAHRPIKAVYIRELVAFADAVAGLAVREKDDDDD
jgi:hypothetical protein